MLYYHPFMATVLAVIIMYFLVGLGAWVYMCFLERSIRIDELCYCTMCAPAVIGLLILVGCFDQFGARVRATTAKRRKEGDKYNGPAETQILSSRTPKS